MADLRDEFEALFPIPNHCERCGNGYVATSYNAWEASDYIAKWEGFKAARESIKVKLPPERDGYAQSFSCYEENELIAALEKAGVNYE